MRYLNLSREQLGWCCYDWANSAFSTTVLAILLGPYLTALARASADPAGFVHLLGVPLLAGSVFPYAVSLSALLQIVCLPLVGAIADYAGHKKLLLGTFAFLGAAATTAFYLVDADRYLLGVGLFLLASLAFSCSIVVYNAFLPEIAPASERHHVSSVGWAIGYLGGGLLLAANLVLVAQAERLGLTTGQAVRISLASAGLWWALFTLVPLLALRERRPQRRPPVGSSYLTVGVRQLAHTFRGARRYPQTLLFLGAYLLYNDGIQTVIALSSQFAQEELGLPITTLTAVALMVQFVGIAGTLLFAGLARRVGAKPAIMVSLIGWSAVLLYAYGFLRTDVQYAALGAAIALVLGGSQALSRSLFSQMIPREQEAEYFGLYEVSERGTRWLGPLLFGLALQFTGSYRVAILSLIVFFVAGLALLSRVDVPRGVRAVHADQTKTSDAR
jgi:UMF1 family MFS transporter